MSEAKTIPVTGRSAPYIPLQFKDLGFPSCFECEHFEECKAHYRCPIFPWLIKVSKNITHYRHLRKTPTEEEK